MINYEPIDLKIAYKLGAIYSFVYSKTIYKKNKINKELLDSRKRILNSKINGYSYNSIYLKDIKQLEKFLSTKDDVIIYIPENKILFKEIVELAIKKEIKIIKEM